MSEDDDKIVTARDLVTPGEFKTLVADAKAPRWPTSACEQLDAVATDPEAFDPEGPGQTVVEDVAMESALGGVSVHALRVFKTAARALKAAELAFRDAQQVYAEAVKQLSEEAVK